MMRKLELGRLTNTLRWLADWLASWLAGEPQDLDINWPREIKPSRFSEESAEAFWELWDLRTMLHKNHDAFQRHFVLFKGYKM